MRKMMFWIVGLVAAATDCWWLWLTWLAHQPGFWFFPTPGTVSFGAGSTFLWVSISTLVTLLVLTALAHFLLLILVILTWPRRNARMGG